MIKKTVIKYGFYNCKKSMKDFKPINDTAESVEKRMTFIQEFLQKKYGVDTSTLFMGVLKTKY